MITRDNVYENVDDISEIAETLEKHIELEKNKEEKFSYHKQLVKEEQELFRKEILR